MTLEQDELLDVRRSHVQVLRLSMGLLDAILERVARGDVDRRELDTRLGLVTTACAPVARDTNTSLPNFSAIQRASNEKPQVMPDASQIIDDG